MLQSLGAHVKQQSYAAGHPAEVPDMRDWSGKLYMPHALAADLGAGNLYAALVAHHALIAHSLIFAAVTFPILSRAENSLAEQSVLFGLLCTVVYSFRLSNLTVRPFADFIGARNRNLHRIEII